MSGKKFSEFTDEDWKDHYFFLANSAKKALLHRKERRALGITNFELELLEKMEKIDWNYFTEKLVPSVE